MVKYELKIKKPNKEFVCFSDLNMKELIKTIQEQLKKIYDISGVPITRNVIYNLQKQRNNPSSVLRHMCKITQIE